MLECPLQTRIPHTGLVWRQLIPLLQEDDQLQNVTCWSRMYRDNMQRQSFLIYNAVKVGKPVMNVYQQNLGDAVSETSLYYTGTTTELVETKKLPVDSKSTARKITSPVDLWCSSIFLLRYQQPRHLLLPCCVWQRMKLQKEEPSHVTTLWTLRGSVSDSCPSDFLQRWQNVGVTDDSFEKWHGLECIRCGAGCSFACHTQNVSWHNLRPSDHEKQVLGSKKNKQTNKKRVL